MLTSIELRGFKSFADRTKIDLDGSVCALIGPNGSGKSNVVDAIKWALGEQSAKRLRGDEMTDVIFNGSASRQALASAEVTISFDNTKRLLPLDADDIHLTRRVYRSGESEYLINGQSARLKDFRDIVGGVGLGAQGYAIIEQGRVEALLQSTSEQRRAVLEDAAGTSRFNVKKQEATRRLERVEQNLQRLSDIVNELETQLRKTKAQAGKAEEWRQSTTRLQKLRTEVTLYEWRVKTEALRQTSVETDDFDNFEAQTTDAIRSLEETRSATSTQIVESDRLLRATETELSNARERIAAEESKIEYQTAQIREWRHESDAGATQDRALVAKRASNVAETEDATHELTNARDQAEKIKRTYESENAATEQLTTRVNALSQTLAQLQQERNSRAAESTRFAGELATLKTRLSALTALSDQKTRQRDEIEKQREESTRQGRHIVDARAEISARREDSLKRMETIKERRDEIKNALSARQIEFSEMERRRAAFEERSALLNDLLRRYEGLSPGVLETLRAMKNPASPFHNAYGLVADLIRVNVEAAPLIELALGQTAQYVVVPPEPELFRYIERQGSRFAGRVGFIWLDPNPSKPIPLNPKLENHPGALGRADQFVETEPLFLGLVQRLLHRTWIVESVAVAKQLYRETEEPTNFLAADGSLLSADGTLVVGSAQGSAGLISRRSELASLDGQTERLNQEFEELNSTVAGLKTDLETQENALDQERTTQRETAQALEKLRLEETASQERAAQQETRLATLNKELTELDAGLAQTRDQLAKLEEEQNAFNSRQSELDANLAQTQKELDELYARRQESAKTTTNLKIELAKAEERIVFLVDRIQRLSDERAEQSRLEKENGRRVQALDARLVQAELSVLNSESQIALLYGQKEALAATIQKTRAKRVQLEKSLAETTGSIETNRAALDKRREAIRSKELQRERYAQEIKTLADRLREDYGLEVEELEYRLEDDPNVEKAPSLAADNKGIDADVELVVPIVAKRAHARKKEIEELRAKLQQLGPVNLEAIESLETLRSRYTTLYNQYTDLLAARKGIQKIIERVNSDCKRLFEETFNAVRANFGTIFQKLFGGGKADLTLENPSNPLEGGVEIVARPPGKELRSLSLMSGGEKSLTCVALLLAIFQAHSSPICILDEVDAALDEANIHRFANAILDFVPKTQFLVVTHSKKTTSTAKSIYGVTMEESGVSKILSVHFDDVGDDGEILLQKPSTSLKMHDGIRSSGA